MIHARQHVWVLYSQVSLPCQHPQGPVNVGCHHLWWRDSRVKTRGLRPVTIRQLYLPNVRAIPYMYWEICTTCNDRVPFDCPKQRQFGLVSIKDKCEWDCVISGWWQIRIQCNVTLIKQTYNYRQHSSVIQLTCISHHLSTVQGSSMNCSNCSPLCLYKRSASQMKWGARWGLVNRSSAHCHRSLTWTL